MRTLFPGARLGNCVRHALLKLPQKLIAIASPVRKALRAQSAPASLTTCSMRWGAKTTTRQELCQRRTWNRGRDRPHPVSATLHPVTPGMNTAAENTQMSDEWLVRGFHTTTVQCRRVIGLVSAEREKMCYPGTLWAVPLRTATAARDSKQSAHLTV
jgi:hypothetical protein